ncbi:hypothetical protein DVG78_03635 [Runella aurantiaca]|uniref:Uncharacterized protein n=1 Tax=Runella aurantiaca TaxID=2282308 RepID=A0A369IBU8_9BACT|nr:hypothetical protein DVG78_03635 [Runella aurantiaca]
MSQSIILLFLGNYFQTSQQTANLAEGFLTRLQFWETKSVKNITGVGTIFKPVINKSGSKIN